MLTNEKKIYTKILEDYPNLLKSVTELSFSSAHQDSVVHLNKFGIQFESIKNCHPLCESQEKSPDAFFLFDDALYFLEFKYGATKKIDIRQKIHEALLALYRYVVDYCKIVTREQFFSLDIKYLVIERPIKISSFADTLVGNSKKYDLKNIEGFIVKQTAVLYHAKMIEDFFIKHTKCKREEMRIATPE